MENSKDTASPEASNIIFLSRKLKQNLLVDFPKECTRIEGMMESQIMPGFSMGSGPALEKALVIANGFYARYHALQKNGNS